MSILFKNISYIDENFNVVENGYIGVTDEKINYIGSSLPEGSYLESYDGKNKLLMPSFVNAHTHIPMTLLRGYAENLPLKNWLFDKVFPFEKLMTGDDIYTGSMHAISELIKCGITSITEMNFHTDRIAQAVGISGIKANISHGTTCFDERELFKTSDWEKTLALYDNYHKSANGRVLVDFCIHAEYTNNEEVIRTLGIEAKKRGVNVHIHLSETKDEHDECIARYNMTPAALFEKCGIFENKTIAAHCVWINNDDIEILKRNNVTVAHNPVSNLKLNCGIAPINELIKNGVLVAIGTDGVASNNSHNMFEEIKLAALLDKFKNDDVTLGDPKSFLRMATLNGALSQGRTDSGVIKVGNKADLVVLDLNKPEMAPAHDLLANIVYSANPDCVVMTMADGKVLYKNGEYLTLDIEEIIYNSRKTVENIKSKLHKT